MNTTYNQYCEYLKQLLAVECAEKELDFDKLYASYITPQQTVVDPKDTEEEIRRMEEENRMKEEARQKELEEIRRKEAERLRQIEENAYKNCTTIPACDYYLKTYPKGSYVDDVLKIKAKLEAKETPPTKRGDIEFEDGYYVGQTQNGLMHGHGTRYWDYDDKKWEGDWVEGEACGHVVVTFGDFVVFEGNMEHGLPNGQGIYTDMNNGQRYEGNFVDFQRDGEGILYTEDGDKIYDGEWKNNKYNGYGQFFLRGQCRYEGNWEHGKRNGDGIAYDQNGNEEYNGPWKDDVRLNDIDRIEVASQEN